MVSYPTIILHSTIDCQELRCYVEVDLFQGGTPYAVTVESQSVSRQRYVWLPFIRIIPI